MNNLNYYKELVENLNNRLAEVQNENETLRQELSRCNGKIDVLSLFYSEFRYKFDDKFNSPPESFFEKGEDDTKPHHDILLNQYFVNHDPTLVERLLRDYKEDRDNILTSLRNQFPPNMVELVNKYDCVEEYKIILKSLELIEKVKDKKSFQEKGIVELIDRYIQYYNKGKRNIALNTIRQALIYYPLLFNNIFINKIKNYWYDDLDNVIRDIRVEYYGREKAINTKRKPRTASKEVKNKKHIDYATISIDDAITRIKNLRHNKTQEAKRTYRSLEKKGRSDDELLEFLEKIDEYCVENNLKLISERI